MNSDDDIVTRLQQWGTHEYLKDTNINAIMCEAADEIERLQNIIEQQTRFMQDAITSLAGNPPKQPTIIKTAGNPL